MSSGGGPDVEPRRVGHGTVVVLSGPSAVGKSSVVRCLRERIPNLHFSVSATTRAPRPGEVDGVDYHFVSPDRFQQLIDEGDLLEWAEIHGGLQRSGTLAEPVRAATAAGLPVLIEVDLAGARAVKKAMPEAITVFLAPPSWADLEARLPGGAPKHPRRSTPAPGHRKDRTRRPGRLRHSRREQTIGVRVRGIGILAGGNCAGLGMTAARRSNGTKPRSATYNRSTSQEIVFSEYSAVRRVAGRRARLDQFDPSSGGPRAYDTPLGITNPPIDELLDRVSSKYALVIYAAKRARQINDYYNQLGEGILEYVGPLVEPGLQEKPLSIAMREIHADLLEHTEGE